MREQHWFVYMVECSDGTLYTGVTTDVVRRVAVHNSPKAAKYTRARQPVRLVYEEHAADRGAALRREAEIKRFPRNAKQNLFL